jgi:predicted Zn-dependent protease
LQRKRKYYRANRCYLIALNYLENTSNKSFAQKEYEAWINYKVGRINRALDQMKDLYEESGQDASVGSTYANMLMDNGNIKDAAYLLETISLKTKEMQEGEENEK